MLVSVYHPYRWVAPFTHQLVERFWPGHPPIFFCGLTSGEAGALPHIPCRQEELPRSWARFVHDAAVVLRERGFEKCYFLLEDHPPLAPCHEEHLHKTLPGLVEKLPASYIGLMGWDNRRFVPTGPILSGDRYRMMHLCETKAPRFHLHPSLFRMDALIDCLALLLQRKNQTPWGFEKTCDKPDAALPELWKSSCYQVCGEEMSLHPGGRVRSLLRQGQRKAYHRLMSFFPLLHKAGLGMAFWDMLGYDNFFQDGPYPMFYSGVMARGRINLFFVRHVRKHFPGDEIFSRLLECAEAQTAAAVR